MISVVMPVYNAEKYIKSSIESVLCQDFKDFELIIVDNNSTDNSTRIIKNYCSQDYRIKYLHESRQGISFALNTGIKNSQFSWIARMDADDVANSNWLNTCKKFIAADVNKNIVLFSTGVMLFERDEHLTNEQILPKKFHPCSDGSLRILLTCCSPFFHPGSVFKKDKCLMAGGYRNVVAEDYDLWLRLSAYGKLSNIDRVLIKYRLTDGSLSTRKKRRIKIFTVVAGFHYFLKNFQSLLGHYTMAKQDNDFLKFHHGPLLKCYLSVMAAIKWCS